ncbi:MAG TPA: type II toxin-antitoxin system VapC family toxin [Gemmatimonadales bacterium]|nr:type II toxin-antitoxin system VapC family toxin [Gemmatimonadales bacterium]
MIVVDASAMVELLLRTPAAALVAQRVFQPSETLHAPQVLDLEVAQVLRRYATRAELTPARGAQAIELLLQFPIERYPHEPLLRRIWRLRDTLTAYDAAYIALAEVLDAPLLTRDQRLARAPGHRARVELV